MFRCFGTCIWLTLCVKPYVWNDLFKHLASSWITYYIWCLMIHIIVCMLYVLHAFTNSWTVSCDTFTERSNLNISFYLWRKIICKLQRLLCGEKQNIQCFYIKSWRSWLVCFFRMLCAVMNQPKPDLIFEWKMEIFIAAWKFNIQTMKKIVLMNMNFVNGSLPFKELFQIHFIKLNLSFIEINRKYTVNKRKITNKKINEN